MNYRLKPREIPTRLSGKSGTALQMQKTEEMVWEVTHNTHQRGWHSSPENGEIHTQGKDGCCKRTREVQRDKDRETSCRLVDREVVSELGESNFSLRCTRRKNLERNTAECTPFQRLWDTLILWSEDSKWGKPGFPFWFNQIIQFLKQDEIQPL